MAETKPEHQKIEVTVEQLKQAVLDYDILLPSEIAAVFWNILRLPPFGMKATPALQQAVADVFKTKPMTVEDAYRASALPAFLIGLLVGIGQWEKPRIIA